MSEAITEYKKKDLHVFNLRIYYFNKIWNGTTKTVIRRTLKPVKLDDRILLLELDFKTDSYTGRSLNCTVSDLKIVPSRISNFYVIEIVIDDFLNSD